MWELIRANNTKSVILFVAMALCLLALGFFIGAAFDPYGGGWFGLLIAVGIWIILAMISLSSADSIFLSISKARPITHDIHPQLFNVTEEMKLAASLPVMPKLYVIEESAPNAFATGYDVNNSSIAVTTGLLSRLNRDELQGVIAHEMGHILNRDIRFITFAGIFLGSITLIAEVFLRGLYYSGGGSSRRYSSGRGRGGGGQAQLVMMVVAIVFAILAPIFAQLLYFAISRKREYLADATSARLTRYPEGLAAALEKISCSPFDLKVANKVTAPMYIINPLKREGESLANLTSTHPPIDERIKILRGMMGGAHYQEYQNAFAQVHRGASAIIPPSGLQDITPIPIRPASQEPVKPKSHKTEIRDLGDLTRAINGFAFVLCVCGLKIKTPPNFQKSKISCPRCHRTVEIPLEELAAVGTAVGAAVSTEPQKIVRQTSGWQSAKCNSCGHLVQISSLFAGTHMKCSKCKNTIEIIEK